MKKVSLAILAAAFMLTACGDNTNTTTESNTPVTEVNAVSSEGESYNVVAEESAAKWHGTKVGGEHSGTINVKEGELTVANEQVTGGTVVIDMTTIANTDITDAEFNGKLVGHLKSDDFFGVEQFPTATFVINKLSPIADAAAGQPNYNVEGDLTIKGKTNPVSFPAVITVENGVAKAKADVVVDRAKYDVRYGSKSFFDDLGDKVIADEFTVSFDVTAKK